MVSKRFQLLVDADALVALAKKDDHHHEYSTKVYQNLESLGVKFFLSPFSIPEATTVLNIKAGREQAVKFFEQASTLGYTELEILQPLKEQTLEWIKRSKKGTSYFDCYNMSLMKTFSFDAIFSFDKIYGKHGFRYADDLT